MSTFEIVGSLDELTPEPDAVPVDVPRSDNDLTCQVCGKPLTYAGRGRRPRFCADHRPGASRGERIPTSRVNKDEKLRDDLAGVLTLVGTGVFMVERFDGLVILDRSEATATALVAVAQENKQVRKVLESLVAVTVYGALVTAVASIAVPIAAHHGVVPIPELTAATLLRLSPDTIAQLATLGESASGV